MWDLSFQTRDQTHAPAMEALSLNHWATRELPMTVFILNFPINSDSSFLNQIHLTYLHKTHSLPDIVLGSLNALIQIILIRALVRNENTKRIRDSKWES